MAIKVEHHTDCLVKVFQALYQLPDVISFPWTLSSRDQVSYFECWKFVADLITTPCQRDTLKCALLYFLSRMVFVMHGMTSNKDSRVALEASEALQEFSNITLETSSPTESVELRLCTAQVLGHTSVAAVMVDLQGTLSFGLCLCL
ncbi:hypothetical protein OS493_012947 [Desmophyllum pertusum]|uniref:Uncharacterized protein n=1 Tax=Desmophyllum pertusum TaxID=174260 RepID=A0A9W9Z1L4_9CNID|nr:hypothetical protein OS493_012947 [Desmophyllum pertusum]